MSATYVTQQRDTMVDVLAFLAIVEEIGIGRKNRFGTPQIDSAISEALRALAIKRLSPDDRRCETTLDQMGKVARCLKEEILANS